MKTKYDGIYVEKVENGEGYFLTAPSLQIEKAFRKMPTEGQIKSFAMRMRAKVQRRQRF